MLVRIRLQQGPAIRKKRGKNRHLALALSALLGPAALMAFVLGAWALAAELRWIGEFAIQSGLFAQWEIWMSLGAGLIVLASALNRYGLRNSPRETEHAAVVNSERSYFDKSV